ncbi:unnamed protein product [Medioppia subpectinata]|uniref:Uncharacterized protein n=1 Tax=Medioppia subpectinata TaxID=1979941 RepID=A0A7R9KH85_9ACAR|nr:unnamed protein product [Medioppia subpectinata]CAG2103513.1 unnamed protein product [Medioppia subpectinata]
MKVGFVNKLFYCFLPENVDQIYGKVVVRFHNMDIISLYGSETHLNTFLTRDLLAEMSWLRHQVLAIKSPVLFSHNDFNRTNILIRDLNPDNNELDIYFVDFDFSSYNYRGCDFGNYFSTWASDSAEFGVDSRFPTNCQMCPFIDGYIREMTAINGNSFTQLEINSRQRLIKEAKREQLTVPMTALN